MHAAILFVLACGAAPAAEPPEVTAVGRIIEPIELNDHLGTPYNSRDWSSKKAVVVVFLGVECPLAKLYGPRLEELAQKYADKNVAVVGINSNQQDTLAEIAHFAREHAITFPLLRDPGNSVADRFGARRTPEAFILDSTGRVRYQGRIDDLYGVGYVRSKATRNDLTEALDELLAGKEISRPTTDAVGCLIGRVRRSAPTGDITFSKHVAPIVYRNCARCHRPGEVAPFSLTSYDDVSSWGQTIAEVVAADRMPPWHANPKHGRFMNDARLSQADKETLAAWVSGGCPEGDKADLPELPRFAAGWQIPQPDVVYKMPKPFNVPARGVVEYQHFVIDPGFTEDKWVKYVEARPGNRAVTHHLIAFFHPPGSEEWEPIAPLYNSLAGFAPGMPPAFYPEGNYRRIPAGSKIVIQAHYTPNGRAQQDQSEVGLVFADPKTVKKEFTVAAVLNFRFLIPPGAANHEVEGTHRFDADMLLYSLTPHMHLRGKAFRFAAKYPDGREEILLDVPRYDFNWQNTYGLAEPKRMPEGTEIRCTAVYDNSEENLANPNPKMPVMWGDQTWQEMMVGSMGVCLADQDLSLGLPVAKRTDAGDYEVTFTYKPSGKAEAVYLAGEFNEWNATGRRMDGPDAAGRYATTITLPAGDHQYKFVVNGDQWRSDPGNPNQVGFYRNSQLRLGGGNGAVK